MYRQTDLINGLSADLQATHSLRDHRPSLDRASRRANAHHIAAAYVLRLCKRLRHFDKEMRLEFARARNIFCPVVEVFGQPIRRTDVRKLCCGADGVAICPENLR